MQKTVLVNGTPCYPDKIFVPLTGHSLSGQKNHFVQITRSPVNEDWSWVPVNRSVPITGTECMLIYVLLNKNCIFSLNASIIIFHLISFQALDGVIPFSCNTNERLFLRNFVHCLPNTSGGRLARWLQVLQSPGVDFTHILRAQIPKVQKKTWRLDYFCAIGICPF